VVFALAGGIPEISDRSIGDIHGFEFSSRLSLTMGSLDQMTFHAITFQWRYCRTALNVVIAGGPVQPDDRSLTMEHASGGRKA
jgi:hypothetical protein